LKRSRKIVVCALGVLLSVGVMSWLRPEAQAEGGFTRFPQQSSSRLSATAAVRPFATITVNSTSTAIANDGQCTLIEAISAANTDTPSGGAAGECSAGNGTDTILLQAGATYAFTAAHNFEFGPNALPIIQSNITIQGNGALLLRGSGAPKFRFFYVAGSSVGGLPTGSLTLRDLTLQGGLAKGGDSHRGGGGAGMGGAIFNHGVVTLERVTLTSNTAQGGSTGVAGLGFGGGGIGGDANNNNGGGFGGMVTGTGGNGGNGGSGPTRPGGGGGGFRAGDDGANAVGNNGGNGGNGGGQGQMGGNGAGGAGYGGMRGDGGGGGYGGNGFNDSSGSGGGSYGSGGSSISTGSGGGGGGVGGGGGFCGSSGGGGGGGGFGGGGGGGTAAGDGGFGGGGGAGSLRGLFGFAGGNGGTGGSGGGGGLGGAIFNHLGTLTLINCTLTNNTAQGGNGSGVVVNDINLNGGSGGSGFGAGLFNLNGIVTLANSTLAANTVVAGLGSPGSGTGNAGSPGTANGGAVYNLAFGNTFTGGATTAAVTIHNSILATTNGGNDLVNDKRDGSQSNTATIDYGGRNIVMTKEALSGTTFTGTLYSMADPQLGGLITLGSKPAVLPITMTSPAFNTAVCDPQVNTDELGTVRPQGAGCDIGAYEFPISTPSTPVVTISDPFGCTGPGKVLTVTVVATNLAVVPQAVAFTVTLPTGLAGLPGTGTSTVGSAPTVNATNVSFAATLAAGQSVTVTYQVQIGDISSGATLCINTATTFNGIAGPSVQACATINCPAAGPGALFPITSEVSGQKAGSVLVYNLYSSSVAAPNTQNTRVSLTNIHPTQRIAVHLFFVDGATCSIADSLICLTPNQTASFLSSDIDPGTTGYIVAVASDLLTGCPVNFNFLLGDEYVKLSSGHAANLAAESFTALAGGLPRCDANSPTAVLNFDGVSYNRAPRALAASNIPSRADGNDTLLVLNRLGGNLATGAATLSNLFGIFYDDAEQPFSFSFSPGLCQFRSSLSNSFPRTVPRLEQIIPAGRSGWAKFYSLNDQGLLGAQINFNPNAGTAAGAFNQGHNLHKLTLTSSAVLTIPIFPPNC
jgi:hypothetical protein